MQQRGNPNDADQFLDEATNTSPIVMLEKRLTKDLADVQADTDSTTKNDKNMQRKDTVEVIIDLLGRIKAIGHEINQQTEEVRERLYYLTFNATVMIFKICTQLRKAGFAKQATHFMAFNILCLDNNLILTTVKYLDWRVLNYVELARAYADMGAFKAAQKVIEHGIAKVLYTKKIEEQDPPVPTGTKDTLIEALRILRTQELKYLMQNGAKADEWKKKLEEVFNSNKYHRSLAIVECLSLNDVHNCHLVQRNAKHLQIKTECLRATMTLVKPDIELVKTALIQIHEKKKRDKEKRAKFSAKEPGLDIDGLLEQYKALDEQMIKENDWKFASKNVPIEVHVELLKLCYEAQLWADFDALLDPALVRLKFRRYETPYLATVDIQMSAQKISNIPNGFERLPKDLNAANLKIELKKLRASAKKGGLTDDGPEEQDRPSTQTAEKTAVKKEETKKVDPKAKPDAKAPPAKVGKPVVEAKQEESKDEEETIVATQRELDLIQHIYVSMLLQRTKNPQNAIVGIDVVMSDEVIGPDLPDSHFAVAVPIRQHYGVYEKTKLIPYVVFRRTANSLIDEEDCLSIVTDVQVMMGQDRHLRAPLGYTKIPIDLRQTPSDLERVHNLDYVFLCYKTDKQLSLSERDLLIFRRLAELERSYIPKNTAEYKQLSDEDRCIGTTYNMDFLSELAKTMKEALLGPLGDYYLEQRRDILNDICYQVYAQYLLPVLTQIDNYVEIRNQREFYVEHVDIVDEHVIKVKNQFLDIFNVIHRVLSRELFADNIIMYIKFSIYFANLLEETGDFRNAVQSLRTAISKVLEYREERMKSTVDQTDSPSTSMSITVDNKKIGDLEEKIRIVTNTWKESILRKERDRARKEKEQTPVEEDEGDEEQFEMRSMIEELKDKDLFEKEIDRIQWHKEDTDRNKLVGKLFYSEQDQIVHALHADLLVDLYRCEVKLGKEMGVVKSQTNKLLTTQGIDLSKHAPGNLTKNLADSLSKKMDQVKTSKTLAGSKAALKELKQTLQEAGKLPPEKPQSLQYEKILERENNQNPYQQALLYMSLAVAKSNPVSQKSLLLEAYEQIKKARNIEESMSVLLLENSIYVSAARHFHSYFKKSPNQVFPFSLMADNVYIKRTTVPQTPIVLGRTSTSITLKLPFYKPITEYKAWRNIETVALYGKPSGSGVAVSLNNTDYPGTGVKLPPGHIVHVTGLIPNERYVFASGGYTPDGICVNGIGETCKEILTVLPLSLHQICGYLAEIAFKLGKYEIAKMASEEVCKEFIVKNNYSYFFLDCKINPILALRLNTDYIKLTSPIEAKQIAQAFCILAKTSKICKNDVQKKALVNECQIEKQKIDFRIANYYMIALEISTMIMRANLIKRTVVELFNHLVALLQLQLLTPLLLQVLIKCHQAMRLVPSDQMDATSRKVMSCLSFQIMRLGFQTNESPMVKRLIISELPINTRKWRKFVQYQIKRIEPEEKKSLVELDKQGKPIASQPSKDPVKNAAEANIVSQTTIPSNIDPKDVQHVEEKLVKFQEFETEGAALDEFMLSLGDYIDVIKAKTERWKLLINAFQKQVTNIDDLDQSKDQIQGLVEFWESIKTSSPVAQLNAIIGVAAPVANAKDAKQAEVAPSSENENKRYLEFICKCVRRALELPETDLNELNETLTNKVKIDTATEEGVIGLLNARKENLNQDIVVKQRKRFMILEEKVKQMLESRTLSGGENRITTKQLQKIMAETELSIKQTEMGKKDQAGSQQMLHFNSEEIMQLKKAQFLWISEKYFLQGITQFILFSRQMPQRNTFQMTSQLNCIFNDIIRIDFTKFKSVLTEFREQLMNKQEAERAKSAVSSLSDNKSQPAKPSTANPENKGLAQDDDGRMKVMTQFLESMAKAAKFALNSRSWLQLINIILYTWNAFSYDLTNPLELSQLTDAWKSVVVIAECSLFLLEFLQQGGKLRKLTGQEIDQIKNQRPQFNKEGKSVAFNLDQDSGDEEDVDGIKAGTEQVEASKPEESKQVSSTKNQKWWEKVSEFDMYTQASFIVFAVQCLMSVHKWESMVDISNRLNSATENIFASQLLPFIIYAQTTLYQESASNTNDKKRELEERIQMFENWKLTNKKKRSRQAMITGEIPPEEQEFLADKGRLEKEIFRLEVIENLLLSDKDASFTLLENIKRDANNCVESLKACRKLYFQFGTATEEMKAEEIQMGCYGVEQIQNAQIKQKRQSHKVFTNMVIASYKKTVDLLRKRQENLLLIQALHELGNLYYADNNLAEAEIQWNDCVDTIFQKLYSVSQFRQIFADNPQLADAFGSKQVLVGGVVLAKLAKLCYEGKDLTKFLDCIIMAKGLLAAPAQLSLPHPQVDIMWYNHTPRAFLSQLVISIFYDKQLLQPSEVLHAMQVVTQTLIDMEKSRLAFPVVSIMEYIANQVTKSAVLVTKSRVQKAIVAINCGYLNEALQIYRRVIEAKDLPKHGTRQSEFQMIQDGPNYHVDDALKFYNQFSPEHEKNQAAIQFLLKPLEGPKLEQLKTFCSPDVYESIFYLRALFLFRIGELENVESLEKADFRSQILKASEDQARQTLAKLAFNYEVCSLQQDIQDTSDRVSETRDSELAKLKDQLSQLFDSANIPPKDRKGLFENTEENMCLADRQSQTLSMMLRARNLLGTVFRRRGMLLESFYVLRQGLQNFKLYAEGCTKGIENGQEAKEKGSFSLPEIFGGSNPNVAAQVKGAQAKAPAKAPEKAPAGKGPAAKGKEVVDEDLNAREEEERRIKLKAERERLLIKTQMMAKRRHPHILLWLRIKMELIRILQSQNRTEDVTDSTSVVKLECLAVKDSYYIRRLQQVEFMMLVKSGEIQQAVNKGYEIRNMSKKLNHDDKDYAEFIGMFAELLYNIDKREEAVEILKEARISFWMKCRTNGVEIIPQDINHWGDVTVNADRKRPTEDVLQQFASSAPAAQAKGGKPAEVKKVAAPVKGAQVVGTTEDLPVAEEEDKAALDFTKKVQYNQVMADKALNQTIQQPNIYVHTITMTVRFDIRYAQFLIMISNKNEVALKVLTDTQRMIERSLYPNPQQKFYCQYLTGLAHMNLFVEKVLQFQSKYSAQRKYKEALTEHIPQSSIALGEFLIELPNFSSELKQTLVGLLESAKASFEKAVSIGRAECILYEFDFSLKDALLGLSKVHFYLGEYRIRMLEYKYAPYFEEDKKRKLKNLREKALAEGQVNDNLDSLPSNSKDKWEEMKNDKETLAVFNHKKASTHYLRAAIVISKSQREFLDKQHQIGTTNLTDVAKVPREIATELFESSQVNKVINAKLPGFDFKDKTTISSSELLAYLRSLIFDLRLFTFGSERERTSRLICKLHRYLNANLASYPVKCNGDVKDYVDIVLPTEIAKSEILGPQKSLSMWFDFQTKKSQMFYILGPLDEAAVGLDPLTLEKTNRPLNYESNQTEENKTKGKAAAGKTVAPPKEEVKASPDLTLQDNTEIKPPKFTKKQITQIKTENLTVHFGCVEADPVHLSELHQDICDLADSMEASEKLSEACNERDRKGYQVRFENLIVRLGGFFKPVLTEEEADKDINCLDIVKDYIPPLTVDNVRKLAGLLKREFGSESADPFFNAILRQFHRIRYFDKPLTLE